MFLILLGSAFAVSLLKSRLGVNGKLGGNTAEQLTPNNPRDIPYHMVSGSLYEAGEEGRCLE